MFYMCCISCVDPLIVDRGQLPLYLLIHLLSEESRMVRIQARLLSEGKLSRYQRKKYRTMQGRIFKVWEEYSAPGSQKSATSLLRDCAFLYGPTVWGLGYGPLTLDGFCFIGYDFILKPIVLFKVILSNFISLFLTPCNIRYVFLSFEQ